MVHLVLDDPRGEPLGLDLSLLPGLLLRAHSHAGEALHLDVDPGQAQAPLFAGLGLLARPLQHGIDQSRHRIFRIGTVHEHPVQDPELGGGKAHPEGVVHELGHHLDLALQRGVEPIDGHGARPQRGVAELAHVAQRGLAAGARLGVEFLDRRRALLALDLDIGVVGGRSDDLVGRLAQCLLVGHRPMSL